MEPVLFYGVPHGCSFGSIVALEWLGQPYRLHRIDMLADKPGGAFAKASPFGQTPALLVGGGGALSESLAILHHIAARGLDKGLGFAQGTKEFDQLNWMLSYLHTSFHSNLGLGWNAFKLGKNDKAGRELLRTMAREKAAKDYAYLQSLLDGSEWLVGDHKTVADAYFIGIARWGEDLGLFDLAKEFPRLHQHMAKLEADPAVIFAHAIEDEKPATSTGGFRGHAALRELDTRLAA
ncbi:glutathione S-transferase family protein [Aminobacter sp. AP02]|uniref:glutathione S-transferase family protein n=1 Tax=Aminobacter sp. AP02 TaxID=2135737 RepID=UPI000D6CE5A0|nr:glutathione S-transferase family protein [Aminobacter sp. AP02]PWK63524.1 glutathione S-transferase [Aminobacter sp. AP02]